MAKHLALSFTLGIIRDESKMGKEKKLTKRQLAVIEDLFVGELDEQAVLVKHKVSRDLYNRWLANECFTEQFTERIGRAYRQSELIISRYAPLAAAKLVELTGSDKEETARKACLDIISFPGLAPQSRSRSTSGSGAPSPAEQLSPQTASRLLAALAEEKNDG